MMSHFALPSCYSESNSGEWDYSGHVLITLHGVISSGKRCCEWNFDLSG